VYDVTYRQADAYTRTTREIVEYVGRTLTYGNDVASAMELLTDTVLVEPVDPPANATLSEKRLWEKRCDEFVKQETAYKQNMKAAYMIVWGQCSDAMRAKLEARDNHGAIKQAKDVLGLLRNIKDATFSFQGQKNMIHALHEARRRFYTFSQDRNMTCQVYLERFKNQVDVIEHCGGFTSESGIVEKMLPRRVTMATASPIELEVATKKAKERYLAVAFVLGSDRVRYGKLIEDLENSFIQGDDKYPTELTEAYNLLLHWKQDPRVAVRADYATGSGDGVAFANSGYESKGKKDLSHITCFNCKEKGHYANKCPHQGDQIDGECTCTR
jgi:Zinc knuckle